jgi:hypothetical protein
MLTVANHRLLAAYNQCIAGSQPKPDWTGCTATRDTCLSGARYERLARSGTLGRRLMGVALA